MAKLIKAEVRLPDSDIEKLQKALGVIPEKVNGVEYAVKVRRGEIERRRISLIKAEKPAPNQSESQELYRLCRWKKTREEFVTIGWALRSTISGDYFVFSEWW